MNYGGLDMRQPQKRVVTHSSAQVDTNCVCELRCVSVQASPVG